MTACHLQLLLHFPLSPQSHRSSPKTLGSSSTPWCPSRKNQTTNTTTTTTTLHKNPTCEQRYLQPTDTQTMHNPGQPRISGREATSTIYCTHLIEQTIVHTFGTTIKFRYCCSKFKPHGFMEAFSESVRLINPIRQ